MNEQILQNYEYIESTYARFTADIISGKGATCCDSAGKTYIDFTSGIGVNSLGFCDAAWVDAVSAQAAKLQHISNLYYTAPAGELAALLCKVSGLKKAFFANSGAEANECAIKAARKYACDKYGADAQRANIITLQNSFHGRTMATLTATGQEGFHMHFAPFLQGFAYVPPHDLAALKAAITPQTCAIMLELVQGEGGVIGLDPAYVQAVAALCAEQDILLIVDEVQTGIARTGTVFAYQQFGISPDIVTLAKGLGGGLPIGAALFGARVAGVLGAGTHGSTYGGNPVACAGACAVLQRVSSPTFLAEVQAKAQKIRTALAAMPGIQNVSGMGLMLGLELTPMLESRTLAQKCLENGLLILTAKAKGRLLPPLNITHDELNAGLAILQKSLQECIQ